LVLTTYGRSSGFAIDPIEKKPLNHFYPGSEILSFGTAGCNLTCKFCQNWHISKSRQMDLLQEKATPETIARAAQRLGCRSVAYTYNDPVIFTEYAIDIADACRARGILNVAVTAGYIQGQAREDFFRAMDAANVDLKSFSPDFYRRLCSAELEPVLETLQFIRRETDIWLEITTLLIPGENDSPGEIERLSEWILENLGADTPLHFTAFHPDWRMSHIPATPFNTLRQARDLARSCGLHYVYTGNVFDPEGQNTYCHKCGEILIGRRGYFLSEWNLTPEAECSHCGTKCAGVFAPRPDSWGGRVRGIHLDSFTV